MLATKRPLLPLNWVRLVTHDLGDCPGYHGLTPFSGRTACRGSPAFDGGAAPKPRLAFTMSVSRMWIEFRSLQSSYG